MSFERSVVRNLVKRVVSAPWIQCWQNSVHSEEINTTDWRSKSDAEESHQGSLQLACRE